MSSYTFRLNKLILGVFSIYCMTFQTQTWFLVVFFIVDDLLNIECIPQ